MYSADHSAIGAVIAASGSFAGWCIAYLFREPRIACYVMLTTLAISVAFVVYGLIRGK